MIQDQLMMVCRQCQQTLNPKLETYGVLLTMADHTSMAQAVRDVLQEHYDGMLFSTSISRSVSATDSTNEQISLVANAARAGRTGKLGREYQDFTTEFLQRVEG